MKKYIYYLSPFLLIPIITSAIEYFIRSFLFTNSNAGTASKILHGSIMISLLLLCIILGNLSPSDKKFDYVMTAIIPFSLCTYLLIVGFINYGADVNFDIIHAFRVAFQPYYLVLYLIMAALTFVSSFKQIRISRIIKKR